MNTKVCLCGSAKYESVWKFMNEQLSLAGFTVYSLSVYPSDKGGKNWYTEKQKRVLDLVHLKKISDSEVVLVVSEKDKYIGESTQREIHWARINNKPVVFLADIWLGDTDLTNPTMLSILFDNVSQGVTRFTENNKYLDLRK